VFVDGSMHGKSICLGNSLPVTNLKTKTLAIKLMLLFASNGLQKIFKFDAAPQWSESLMSELTRLLGITCNIATPFHHQSIDGVERLNQTIERMAKNYTLENPRAWDIYVDYLMFAYNSVPSAIPGMSPLVLVFGRNLRCPLNVLTELWTNAKTEKPTTSKDLLTYLADLRKQLETVVEAAKFEAQKWRKRHKEIYDRKSTHRELSVSDKVLIFQPTSSFELFAKWDGPWVVARKLNAVNYEIDRGNRKKILYINMLKKWEDRSGITQLVSIDDEIRDEEKMFWEEFDGSIGSKKFNFGTQLESLQLTELTQLLNDFPDVFR
jgi:hypothetical protein